MRGLRGRECPKCGHEAERLRGLLAVARSGIAVALNSVPRTEDFRDVRRSAEDALVRSDPDAET